MSECLEINTFSDRSTKALQNRRRSLQCEFLKLLDDIGPAKTFVRLDRALKGTKFRVGCTENEVPAIVSERRLFDYIAGLEDAMLDEAICECGEWPGRSVDALFLEKDVLLLDAIIHPDMQDTAVGIAA